MAGFQITQWNHRLLAGLIPKGGYCIDATAGTGQDTLYLAEQVGASGHVISFDIQGAALAQTRERLTQAGCADRAELILDSHVNMAQYVHREADAILFNFGYLPGGDHRIATKAENSLRAVEIGLGLLKKGGVMSLCVYSGGDTGMEEMEALTAYAAALPPKQYLVIRNDYYNRPNHPPIILLIFKL